MSILIKGMKMPRDKDVILRIDSKGEVYIYGGYPTEIHEAVELPDHGDLIDRDALIRDTEKRCCADCDKRKGRKKNGKYGFIYAIGEAPCRACCVDDMVGELEDAKVIIPAERSESDD